MVDEPASNLADKYLDAEGVTIGSTLMLRERTEIAGSTATGIADVITTDPTSATPGLSVRDPAGTVIAGILSIGNANTTAIASRLGSTLFVQLDPGHLLGSVTANAGTGSFNVQFDPGHTLGKVDAGLGTFNVALDPGHELGTIRGNTNTLTVFFPDTGHTLGKVDAGLGTFGVNIGKIDGTIQTKLDAASVLAGITSSIAVHHLSTGGTLQVALDRDKSTLTGILGSVAVYFDRGNPSVNATFSSSSIEVVPTTGSRKTMDDAHAAQRVLVVGSQTAASLTINGTVTANAGTGTFGVNIGKIDGTIQTILDTRSSISGIQSSIAAHILSTNGTMAVNVGKVDGTVTVRFDPGNTLGTVNQGVASATQAWLTNSQNTASIFTVAGSTSGVSPSGVTLVSPSSAYSFKVFAFSLQTTGLVSLVARFTNGGGSATEFWRGLITSNQTTSSPIGANLAVSPPSFLFATGTSVTLSLHLDTATLVHYSVSYIKESA